MVTVSGKVARSALHGRPAAHKTYPVADTARFKCWGSGVGNERVVRPLLGDVVPRTLAVTADPAAESCWLEWITGTPGDDSPSFLDAAGRLLGRIHSSRGAWYGSLDGRYRYPSLAAALRHRLAAGVRLLAGVDPPLAAQVGRWNDRQLGRLGDAPPPALVHGDFGLGNILVTPAGLRAIDWEHARWGHPQEDWAKIRLALRHPEPNGFGDEAAIGHLSAGWRAVTGRPPPDEPVLERLLQVYLAGCLGVFFTESPNHRLAWVHRVTGQGR